MVTMMSRVGRCAVRVQQLPEVVHGGVAIPRAIQLGALRGERALESGRHRAHDLDSVRGFRGGIQAIGDPGQIEGFGSVSGACEIAGDGVDDAANNLEIA